MFYRVFIVLLTAILASGCVRELTDCSGPRIDANRLQTLRRAFFSSGPKGLLVMPNPIDSSGIANITTEDTRLSALLTSFNLPGLVDSTKLETSFLKIRNAEYTEDASKLATLDGSGQYRYALTDTKYSQTMAYYSVSAVMAYIEGLGFSVVKTRPLYVLVRTGEDIAKTNPTFVNVYYSHNYLSPDLPREIRFVGATTYAPSLDRDMYWHEFGHMVNESVSREVGIDLAGDTLASFTFGAALHECLADYLAESLGNKPYIGKWIARNFSNYKAGEPLRSTLDQNTTREGETKVRSYSTAATFDGTGMYPERYAVGEWCTRVLWELRNQFIAEDATLGAVLADRLVYTAVSQLTKDTSIKEFHNALLAADEKLHCGLHERSIRSVFQNRGYQIDIPRLDGALDFTPTLQQEPSADSGGTPEITFHFTITNNSSVTARDVRLSFESQSPYLYVTTYMQGFGDLPPGKSIKVGPDGLSTDFSVRASLNSSTPRGSPLKYRLKVTAENGGTITRDGSLTP